MAAVASLSIVFTLGCRIETDKKGDSDNVRIATPFGGMSVKTNDAAVLEGTGLPPYPGAELVKKDKNNGAADVNMSFGNFHLRVKAVSYRTTDAPTQVAAFYRKALDRYGDVIQCSNGKPIGSPTRTAEGLTCDHDSDHNAADYTQVSGKMEFRAGSKLHQHIVAIEPEGSGTKFGLVALELPDRVTVGDTKDDTRQ
jgi:hypothetical protein